MDLTGRLGYYKRIRVRTNNRLYKMHKIRLITIVSFSRIKIGFAISKKYLDIDLVFFSIQLEW